MAGGVHPPSTSVASAPATYDSLKLLRDGVFHSTCN